MISTALRAPSEYLNLQWFHSYSCKECSYILKKILLRYSVYLFTNFQGRLQRWGPYGRDAGRSDHIESWCHCTRHRTESVCRLSPSITSIRSTHLRNNLRLMTQYASVMIIQEIHDVVLKNLLTYSMVQSPSWESNWFATSQEIPRISRNPKVHYRTHKRPPPVSILGQPNPVHIPTSHFLDIHPNINHPSTVRPHQWSPSLRFLHQDPTHPPLLTHTRHMPSPSHSSRFYHNSRYNYEKSTNIFAVTTAFEIE